MSCPFSDLDLERRLCESYSRQVQKTLDRLKKGGHQDAMVQHLTAGIPLSNYSKYLLTRTDSDVES